MNMLKPCLIAGIMGLVMSVIMTVLITYAGHLQPATFDANVIDNIILAAFSGLMSGFVGVYMTLRMMPKPPQ